MRTRTICIGRPTWAARQHHGHVRDCGRVSDILEMFRIITFSIDHLEENGTPVEKLAFQLEFQGFDHNDPLEGHMATYVEYQLRDDRWSELKPQIEQNDRGNSHARMLDTYMRMLGEYRRVMDSRKRGFNRFDYLLTLDELQPSCPGLPAGGPQWAGDGRERQADRPAG